METFLVWLTSVPKELTENVLNGSRTAMEDSQLIHSFPNFTVSGVQYSNSDTAHTKILGEQKEESERRNCSLYVCALSSHHV